MTPAKASFTSSFTRAPRLENGLGLCRKSRRLSAGRATVRRRDRAQRFPRRGLRMRLSYDRSTDSLYIEVRDLPAKRTREIEPDVMLDLGEDGEPVGYDIQHASTKREFIISVIFADQPQAAAE